LFQGANLIEAMARTRKPFRCCAHGRLARLGWLVVISSVALPAVAQRPDGAEAARRFAEQMAQATGNFFGESPTEREAIEAVAIDARDERRIGDAALEAHLASLKQQRISITQQGRDAEYVKALVKSIQPLMRNAQRYEAIRVHIANSEGTDARAFPGGSIVVMTGLIELARSEAALIGVLGHELSHIDHGHQLRMARAVEVAQTGWSLNHGGPQAMQDRILMMSKNFARPYRAEDEAAADQDGATWAFELGYAPRELAELIERLDARREPGPGRANIPLPSFLLTHPPNGERLAAIRARSAELQAARRDVKPYVGRENLQRRIPRAVREFPN
jgi:predicted Zn-dependent protease